MNTMKLMFITLTAVALMLTITLQYTPSKRESEEEEEEMPITVVDGLKTSSTTDLPSHEKEQTVLSIKRVTHRFLAEKTPRAAANEKFHFNKDEAVCNLKAIPGSSCCNNKCVDLTTDKQNCGACKNKCKYPESCCRGKCVNLAFDKRHCGECNHSCMSGGYCVYGMCNYA